jgi:hypothetical protein
MNFDATLTFSHRDELLFGVIFLEPLGLLHYHLLDFNRLDVGLRSFRFWFRNLRRPRVIMATTFHFLCSTLIIFRSGKFSAGGSPARGVRIFRMHRSTTSSSGCKTVHIRIVRCKVFYTEIFTSGWASGDCDVRNGSTADEAWRVLAVGRNYVAWAESSGRHFYFNLQTNVCF